MAERAGRGVENGRPRLPRVLVAEDERDVAELIRHHLTKDGYDAVLAKTGTEALELARREKPDLILLDIMIPEMNGWEVCRCLKREPETSGIPVIMVSGRVEEGDKVLGFTKPFSPRELLARIRAVARRRQGGEATAKRSHLKAGRLEIDRERFEVTVGGRAVILTPKEFELLATLVAAPGRVFRRDELLDLVWGRDGFVEPRTVDVHMARLRAKFLDAKVDLPDAARL